MSDVFLKRPIWLTVTQRARLRAAVAVALEDPAADWVLCESILVELDRVVEVDSALYRVIRAVVQGLKLPGDISPVFLCTAQTDQVMTFGRVDRALAGILASHPLPPVGSG